VNCFQIPTDDFKRAVKFYSTILGNDIKVMDFQGQTMGFFPMSGGPESDRAGGALMPPTPGLEPSSSGTQVFLACDGQLDAVIGRVEKAGGKIATPKTSIGQAGFFAFVQDTEGNVVGLHSWE
jgi:predicted enzyme related to lactoylglutathione lyase